MLFRNKYIVNKRQILFCLKILAITLVPFFLITVSVLLVFWRLERYEYIDFLSRNPVLVVEYIKQTITHILLSFFLLNGIVIFATLLVYSNRVFGPIDNLKKKLMKFSLRNQQFPELKFRKSDEFLDLAEALNKNLQNKDF